MSWFPVPARPEDIELLEPHGHFTRTSVFELLTDLEAEEWRQKVGVAGRADGSAKATTRLLASGDWVAKTRIDEVSGSAGAARERAVRARAAGAAARVWHPSKLWAILRVGDAWYGLTVCRRLSTLRDVPSLDERLVAWTDMVQTSLRVHRAHGLGLDVNPANFGREKGAPRLYYLDDEFYATFGERDVAAALVARIPEEPDAPPETWGRWGERLATDLDVAGLSWERIRDEIARYPLPEAFESARAALVHELPRERSARSRAGRRGGAPRLTCVLADVHGNGPALDAVLEDARAKGADSFLFLGDAVGYGPDPSRCVRTLADLSPAVFVRGNHDHAIGTGHLDVGMNGLARRCAEWTLSALDGGERHWLANLPVDHAEDGFLAVHGAPKDPRRFLAYVYELTYEDNLRYLSEERIPLCFYGHTHVQMTHAELVAGPTKLPGSRTIKLDARYRYLVNPGSVGQPRDGDARAAYALWDRSAGTVTTHRVGYDVERTIHAIGVAGLPSELEFRLRGGV
jgi:diadenosine tetraphosphatase ApaH/serine/threonine PP2A family protein phosphatase